jgi:gas vesicle protein
MNSFVKGLLVGVGVGLLVAPMRGEEMRRRLGERLQEWRGYLPENEQLNQYVQQVSERVSQASGNLTDLAQQATSKVKDTGSQLGDLAQQATSKVKDTGSHLGTLAQQAGSTVKQTGQDVADTTKQKVTAAKQNTSTTSSTPTTAPFPSAYPDYVNPETKPNTNL